MDETTGKLRTRGDLGGGNRRATLRELVLRGPLPRVELADRLGLTPATISRIARELIDAGLVRELANEPDDAGDPARGPGRRSVRLDIAPEGGQVLGIGIGAAFQTVTLTDLKNRVIAGTELDLEAFDDPDLVIGRLATESRRLIDRHVDDRGRLLGGFAMVSGALDPATGDVWSSPYLGWPRGASLRAKLARLFDLPMRLEPLSAAMALAEARFGAARGRENVLTFSSGIGVSAGLVLGGRLVKGHRFPAGAIGAAAATGEDGAVTTLDRLAAGLGILRRLHGENIGFSGSSANAALVRALRDAIARDRDGDPAAGAAMAAAGRELGRVAAQFVRLAATEIVVIAGPLSMSPRYVAAARNAVAGETADIPTEVVAGAVTGPVSGQSATCGLAICEYLFERAPDLAALSDLPQG